MKNEDKVNKQNVIKLFTKGKYNNLCLPCTLFQTQQFSLEETSVHRVSSYAR